MFVIGYFYLFDNFIASSFYRSLVSIRGRHPGQLPRDSGTRKSGTGTHNKIRDRTQIQYLRDSGLGPGPRFAGRGILGLNYSGLSRRPQRNPGVGPEDCADPWFQLIQA